MKLASVPWWTSEWPIASLQWPSFTGSLNAYFAHRKLEIPPSKRKSYKNLQYAANIQWHRYIYKKSKNICYSSKSNTEKYKKRDALRDAFVYILSIFARFLLTLLYVVIYGPGIWWTPFRVEFRSLLENKLNKEFHTKRQDSPLESESGREQLRFSYENEHSSACQ